MLFLKKLEFNVETRQYKMQVFPRKERAQLSKNLIVNFYTENDLEFSTT